MKYQYINSADLELPKGKSGLITAIKQILKDGGERIKVDKIQDNVLTFNNGLKFFEKTFFTVSDGLKEVTTLLKKIDSNNYQALSDLSILNKNAVINLYFSKMEGWEYNETNENIFLWNSYASLEVPKAGSEFLLRNIKRLDNTVSQINHYVVGGGDFTIIATNFNLIISFSSASNQRFLFFLNNEFLTFINNGDFAQTMALNNTTNVFTNEKLFLNQNCIYEPAYKEGGLVVKENAILRDITYDEFLAPQIKWCRSKLPRSANNYLELEKEIIFFVSINQFNGNDYMLVGVDK